MSHNDELKMRRYSIAAIIIFVLGIMFSTVIWQFTLQAMHKVEKTRFEHYAEMIRALVEERIDEHVAALRGLRAFIDSSETVTRAEWQTYVKDLDIDRHFEGCLGFSFIRYVPRIDLTHFLVESRAETPDFSVDSSGTRSDLYVVEMIQPLERNRKFLGYDLAQDAALREVMAESVPSGRATLSHATSLVGVGGDQAGVLLLLPVYKTSAHVSPNGRSLEDMRGWVGASILVGDMIRGFNASLKLPIDIEILDVVPGNEPTVLYDADGRLHSKAQEAQNGVDGFEMSSRAAIDLFNRTWVLDVYALPGFSDKVTHHMPAVLLWAGFMLSLLCALQVASYGRMLERAQRLATKMTRELRASEERFHRMFQEHNAVMLLVDPESREVVDANAAACRFYHYTREQLISLPIGQINMLSSEETKDAMQQVKDKRKNHFEFRHALASGEVRDVEIYSSPIVIDGNALLFSIIHDITERKHAEHELAGYRENLESLVDEQTQKLKKAHIELLQKERLATLGR